MQLCFYNLCLYESTYYKKDKNFFNYIECNPVIQNNSEAQYCLPLYDMTLEDACYCLHSRALAEPQLDNAAGH